MNVHIPRRAIGVALAVLGAVSLAGGTAHAATNDLAPTPPMGWNSYNAYACDNGAQDMKAVATFIRSSGLERDGYHYINADGCYDDLEALASPNTYAVDAPTSLDPETCGAVNGRLPDGQLFVNAYLFPPSRPCANDGFGVLAGFLHQRGFGLGLYLDASNNWNCEEIPGSNGFDQIDADTLAAWGVDYVKADWGCADTTPAPGSNAPAGYTGLDAAPGNVGFGGPTFATNPAYDTDQQTTQTDMYTRLQRALAHSGRNMLFSIAGASTVDSQQWGLPMADMDRPTGDSNANFTATGSHAAGSVVGIVNADAQTYDALTGPNHWIDPDIMEVGNGALTPAEDRSEMSMFSELADPLIMSTNLCQSGCGPDTTPATKAQLKLDVSVFGNRSVIAVDQDPKGAPAHIVGTFDGTHLVMAKPLTGGDVAVTLFNEDTANRATMSTTAAAIGLPSGQRYRLQNLWSGATTYSKGAISAAVPPTKTVMYRVSLASRPAWRPSPAAPTRAPSRSRSPRASTPGDGPLPGNLLSVACPTASGCSAVDILGQAVSFDPAAPAGAAPVTVAPGHSLAAIACPAATECVTLADGGGSKIFDPAVSPVRTHRAGPVDHGGQPTGLACPSTDECVAVDGEGNEVTYDPTSDGAVIDRHAVDPDTYLAAVSCPSTTQCTATGGGGNNGDTVVTFDPADGSVIAGPSSIDPDTGNGLSSVSCPSLGQCTAADGSGNEVTFDPATDTVNGAGVAPLEGADVPAADGLMNSVSCASVTRCTAVDGQGDEVTFDPSAGTVNAAGVQAIDPRGDGLESVACPPSGSACTAVDLDGHAVSFDPASGAVNAAGVTMVDPGQG